MESEIDRETALRHKRGFEALKQSLRDLRDIPEMDEPEQVDDYLNRVPFDLQSKMRRLLDDITVFLRANNSPA